MIKKGSIILTIQNNGTNQTRSNLQKTKPYSHGNYRQIVRVNNKANIWLPWKFGRNLNLLKISYGSDIEWSL